MGFDIKAYREANTIKISCGSSKSSPVYKAYVTAPITYNTQVNLDSMIGQITTGPLVTAGAFLLGKAPTLDYERKFNYRGTSPMKFTISTALVVVSTSDDLLPSDTIKRCYIDPLKALKDYVFTIKR